LDVARSSPLRGSSRPPLEVVLRYLISASGREPSAVHHTVHQLVFAALIRPDVEVEETPIPAQLWSAFGAVPRPAFVLRYPLRVEQYDRGVPLVREARFVPHVSATTLHGRLTVPIDGPDGKPPALAGARVEVPGSHRSAITDRSGYFRLEHVLPDDDGQVHLRVQARGHTFEIVVRETGSPGAPVTIEVPLPTARLECRLEDRAGKPLAGVRIELPDRRQYVETREDGGFVLDGVPDDLGADQIVASQAGKQLDVRTQEGDVVLTKRTGSSTEPVVVEFTR
jgi:hypothetical protein